jgi:hypothetical protein
MGLGSQEGLAGVDPVLGEKDRSRHRPSWPMLGHEVGLRSPHGFSWEWQMQLPLCMERGSALMVEEDMCLWRGCDPWGPTLFTVSLGMLIVLNRRM